jgi:type 1 glutamine amidotransferase
MRRRTTTVAVALVSASLACLLLTGCPAPTDQPETPKETGEAAQRTPSTETDADAEPPKARPHVLFLISEDPANYEAHQTIPEFAETLGREHAVRTTVLLGEGEQPSFRFPGLEEALPEADLLVVFFRRSALPRAQLDSIKEYVAAGKPVVGIRTANHAFSLRTVAEGHRPWWEFVSDVLGCENRGYGSEELGADISVVPEAADHPILRGVEPAEWQTAGSLYLVDPLLDAEATVLLRGKVEDHDEPVAWTRMAGKSRVFYTSLGHREDFKTPQFRQLLVNGIFWAMDRGD